MSKNMYQVIVSLDYDYPIICDPYLFKTIKELKPRFKEYKKEMKKKFPDAIVLKDTLHQYSIKVKYNGIYTIHIGNIASAFRRVELKK